MRSFKDYHLARTLSEMGEDPAAQVKQQIGAKVKEMADGLRQQYPQYAQQLDGLLQQFVAGKIDPQTMSAQVSNISKMVKQLGPAFGGQAAQPAPAKKPMLGPAFGGQPSAAPAPAAPKKPLLGPAFGG